jgi:hypothetical protein
VKWGATIAGRKAPAVKPKRGRKRR